MKGIRKLFLGLFLMTLISVGFKVDAKADSTQPELLLNWNSSDGLKGQIKLDDTDFPIIDTSIISGTATAIFEYDCKIVDTTDGTKSIGNSVKVYLKTEKTTNGSETNVSRNYVSIGNKTSFTELSTEPYTVIEISKEDVRSSVLSNVTSGDVREETVKFAGELKSSEVIPPTDPTTISVQAGVNAKDSTPNTELKLGKVTAAAYLGSSTTPFGVVTPSEKYLFAGEKGTFTSSITLYNYINWKTDHGTLGTHKKGSCELTMDATPVLTVLKEVYGNIAINDTISGKAGESTTAVPFTNHGYNLPDDISGISFRENDLPKATTTWTGGKFTFAIPDGTPEGTYPLTVIMSDDVGGGIYSFDVTVDNGAKPDIASDVYVTEGMKILLSKFQESGEPTKGVMARINSETSSYASIDPSSARTTPKSISSIYLVGTSNTTKKNGALTVYNATGTDSDTANVTVYPQPNIELNSSSSGTSLNSGTTSSSSADSPFKVTMPTGVYHDGIMWSNVSKAKIVFSYDGKTKEAELDMGSTSGSTSLSKSSSVDSLTVSDIIDDLVGDSDHYKIQITAYPMNGNTVDTAVYDSENVDVYKVSLDGSAGARYYVNGSEKSDHFYAVKGTTYTIKSSAKNSGDKFNNWSDNIFSSESGGSYKVLGARTFKANYGNSSSSSSSGRSAATAGEGMDDYDDVPKTGESKADIWILWSVLFVSILGAGFMIWKRFGLVRAIAEADEQVAVAEHKEEIKAKKKEKEDKIKMLKDLRNL